MQAAAPAMFNTMQTEQPVAVWCMFVGQNALLQPCWSDVHPAWTTWCCLSDSIHLVHEPAKLGAVGWLSRHHKHALQFQREAACSGTYALMLAAVAWPSKLAKLRAPIDSYLVGLFDAARRRCSELT
jgi:hypothetical protein